MADIQRIPEGLINWEEGLNRVGGDEEFFLELLTDLVVLGEENISDLHSALTENNSDAVMRLGHSLKGAAANLGVQSISDYAFQLEKKGKEQNLDLALELVEQLEKRLDQLKSFLES